ncbi:hypothetical protein HPB50_015669 [Hyalomma asiaticum]|uniref:Uncharacterized protein n=1 Tax=Hyalomma asiaticum TaxID=266040 RepID=A0ACB7TLH8_HYAAI|nr:hypothetical protein HPB50_015669 [Hyalomma asiaticum]
MLSCLVQLKEAICLELATSKTSVPNLTPQEWKTVAGLIKALEPITSATKNLSGRKFKNLFCAKTFQETSLLKFARTELQLPSDEESSDYAEASTSTAHKERVSSIWDSIEKLPASSERRHFTETASIEEFKWYLREPTCSKD